MRSHFTFLALAALASSALSLPASQRTFLAPSSLRALSSFDLTPSERAQLESHMLSLSEQRWVRLATGGEPISITEGEKVLLTLDRTRFEDVTDEINLGTVWAQQDAAPRVYPTKLSHSKAELSDAFDSIDLDEMAGFLNNFTTFFNRYYRSPTGKESQQWLLHQLKQTAKELNPKAKITFDEFQHSWGQNSIIVRWAARKSHWQPEEVAKDNGAVVLSSHLDSTALFPFGRAPGADDDGSAVTVLATTFALLLKQGFNPTSHPLEFHFYAAEEGGLLGSKAVARDYAEKGKPIHGLLHMDQVAYVKPGTKASIGLLRDEGRVDQGLTSFVKLVVEEYTDVEVAETVCGYNCSDHASWSEVGLPSSCISESKFPDSNHQTHSSSDTPAVEGFSFEHMARFVKVCSGFALELTNLKVDA